MPYGPILIVDDEPQNLAAMRAILGGMHRMVFAKDGSAAMAAAIKHAPALILMDVSMPDMDGLAVCRCLKADPRTQLIPVIFVTGRSDEQDEAAGFAAGAVDYITKPVSPPLVRARVATHLSLVQASALERAYHDAIFMLGEAGHYNDTDTGAHIWRMAAYAGALAAATGFSAGQRQLLELAAPMHDTGKIGIPDAILRKPGALDADEWGVMKTHAKIGFDILTRSTAPVFQMAAEIALRHHEKWNGAGYPDGLVGEEIPVSARIVAIADVFDALTSCRPYKEAWTVERSVAVLRESAGGHFEPRLVDAFLSIMPEILEIKRAWDTREATATTLAIPDAPFPSPAIFVEMSRVEVECCGSGWVGGHASMDWA